MMPMTLAGSSSVPRTGRMKARHNYANVNKRGLQSLKVTKTKSRVKKSDKSVPTTPGSGNWCMELLNKYDHEHEGDPNHDKCSQNTGNGGKPCNGGATAKIYQQGVENNRTIVPDCTGDSTSSINGTIGGASRGKRNKGPFISIEKVHAPDAVNTGLANFPPHSLLCHNADNIIQLVLQKNMSSEQRKKQLRDNIAQLKKQLHEKEEDAELQALMKEEEELRSQLAGMSDPADRAGNKWCCKCCK